MTDGNGRFTLATLKYLSDNYEEDIVVFPTRKVLVSQFIPICSPLEEICF